MKKPPIKRKQPSLKTLRNRLDLIFSSWIRKRDGNENGMGRCISCNQYRFLQAGHFIKRQHYGRWDERNVNGQCVRCNKWLHGNDGAYAVALAQLYGIAVVKELIANKHKELKPSRIELEAMIERYSER